MNLDGAAMNRRGPESYLPLLTFFLSSRKEIEEVGGIVRKRGERERGEEERKGGERARIFFGAGGERRQEGCERGTP